MAKWEDQITTLISRSASSADKTVAEVLGRARAGKPIGSLPDLLVKSYEEARLLLLRCGAKEALERERAQRNGGATGGVPGAAVDWRGECQPPATTAGGLAPLGLGDSATAAAAFARPPQWSAAYPTAPAGGHNGAPWAFPHMTNQTFQQLPDPGSWPLPGGTFSAMYQTPLHGPAAKTHPGAVLLAAVRAAAAPGVTAAADAAAGSGVGPAFGRTFAEPIKPWGTGLMAPLAKAHALTPGLGPPPAAPGDAGGGQPHRANVVTAKKSSPMVPPIPGAHYVPMQFTSRR